MAVAAVVLRLLLFFLQFVLSHRIRGILSHYSMFNRTFNLFHSFESEFAFFMFENPHLNFIFTLIRFDPDAIRNGEKKTRCLQKSVLLSDHLAFIFPVNC